MSPVELPRLQRREHLRGERLVDLVEVEVLQRQAGALEQPRDGVHGRHQQPLVAVDVVDRRGLGVREVGEHRQVALGRPLVAGEQHQRGAVGQRRRVARRHRVAEHRLELRELVGARVRPQVLVALEAEVRRHEVVEEPALVGGGEALVARHGQLVLVLAGDPPALGGDRLVLAHRHAGARLGVARDLGHDLAGAQVAEQLQPAGDALGAVDLQQHAPQVLVDGDRGVAGGVDAAGDPPVDLAERDLAGHRERGLEAGVAGLLDVVGRRGVVERAAEHALAREVEVARVLEHGAGHHLAGPLALQAEARDEPVERGGEHVLVRGLGVRPVRAGERDAVAAEDRDLLWHCCANVPVHLTFQSGKPSHMADRYQQFADSTPGRFMVRRLGLAAADAAAARAGAVRRPGQARRRQRPTAMLLVRLGFELTDSAEAYSALIFDASRIERTGGAA